MLLKLPGNNIGVIHDGGYGKIDEYLFLYRWPSFIITNKMPPKLVSGAKKRHWSGLPVPLFKCNFNSEFFAFARISGYAFYRTDFFNMTIRHFFYGKRDALHFNTWMFAFMGDTAESVKEKAA